MCRLVYHWLRKMNSGGTHVAKPDTLPSGLRARERTTMPLGLEKLSPIHRRRVIIVPHIVRPPAAERDTLITPATRPSLFSRLATTFLKDSENYIGKTGHGLHPSSINLW